MPCTSQGWVMDDIVSGCSPFRLACGAALRRSRCLISIPPTVAPSHSGEVIVDQDESIHLLVGSFEQVRKAEDIYR
jgi:hypothetical protein